jgi:hypothetical protein
MEWPPVACNMNKSTVICATGGHTGTICMGLAAIQVQFACDLRPPRYNLHATDWRLLGYKKSRQEVCKRLSLHLIIFFSIGKSTSSMHASDFSADSPCVPLTFSFAQLAKGKSLGRSKPATKSQIQPLQHTVWMIFTISKPY